MSVSRPPFRKEHIFAHTHLGPWAEENMRETLEGLLNFHSLIFDLSAVLNTNDDLLFLSRGLSVAVRNPPPSIKLSFEELSASSPSTALYKFFHRLRFVGHEWYDEWWTIPNLSDELRSELALLNPFEGNSLQKRLRSMENKKDAARFRDVIRQLYERVNDFRVGNCAYTTLPAPTQVRFLREELLLQGASPEKIYGVHPPRRPSEFARTQAIHYAERVAQIITDSALPAYTVNQLSLFDS